MIRPAVAALVFCLLLPVAAEAAPMRYPTLDRMLRRFSREARRDRPITIAAAESASVQGAKGAVVARIAP